jgi:hypothetical protein
MPPLCKSWTGTMDSGFPFFLPLPAFHRTSLACSCLPTRRNVSDRKLSTITDASVPHHVHPTDLLAESAVEIDLLVSPVGDASNPTTTSTPALAPGDEMKSGEVQVEEPPLAALQPITEQPDGTTPENPRQERSPTLSSTSSIPTKSSLPSTHKCITELIESHIFNDASASTASTNTPPLGVEELCIRAFSDQYGMDLFLQILDEKRGRCAELEKLGFKNMKIAMKVSLFSVDSRPNPSIGLLG